MFMVVHVERKITIEFGDELLFNLGMSAEQFSDEAKFLLAAKLYELGKISSGQAARLAGKSRVDFLMSLTRLGVPVSNLRPEDAQTEINFARHG
jgi:predicted HTH domain antitoxin